MDESTKNWLVNKNYLNNKSNIKSKSENWNKKSSLMAIVNANKYFLEKQRDEEI